MTDDESKALEAIRAMRWERYDHDNRCAVPIANSLFEVVSAVAMADVDDPRITVLNLLADNVIHSKGDIIQQTYKWGNPYRWEDYKDIDSKWWRKLKECWNKYVSTPELPAETVLLEHIERGEWPSFEWNWRLSSFTLVDADAGEFGNVSENSFYANDIHIFEPEKLCHDEQDELAISPPQPQKNKGGKPAKYEWEKAVAGVVFKWEEGNWEPSSQAEVVRALGDWFSENPDAAKGDIPSSSQLKERARWLFPLIKQRQDAANN